MGMTIIDELSREELYGTSSYAYGNSPAEPARPNRAERRAEMAARRKATRQFNRQLKQLTRGSIFGDDA